MNNKVLSQKISFVQEKLEIAKKYLSDYEKLNFSRDLDALERVVEQIVETSIKINKELLDSINIYPISYQESFLKLDHLGIFEKDFLEKLAKTARFRNELAHEYLDMTSFYSIENIKFILKNYPLYLIKIIKYLKNN